MLSDLPPLFIHCTSMIIIFHPFYPPSSSSTLRLSDTQHTLLFLSLSPLIFLSLLSTQTIFSQITCSRSEKVQQCRDGKNGSKIGEIVHESSNWHEMSGFDDGNSGHHRSSAADFCQIYTTAADSFCVFPPPRCSPSSLLPNFMVPKKVQFMDGLPKTSTGKIQKFQLRAVAKTLVPPPENAETKRRPTPQPQSKRETPRRDHHRNQEQVLALSSRLSLMRSFPFPGHRLPSS